MCRVHYMSQACGTGGGGVFSVYCLVCFGELNG